MSTSVRSIMYRYLHRIHISSHSYMKAILMGEGFQDNS